jgi:hypothetical protein
MLRPKQGLYKEGNNMRLGGHFMALVVIVLLTCVQPIYIVLAQSDDSGLPLDDKRLPSNHNKPGMHNANFPYKVNEYGTGWTTGLRHHWNISTMNISGSSNGVGSFSRYTDINNNDVRMRERISTNYGTVDTDEVVVMEANATEPGYIGAEKAPGNQDWHLMVNEKLPVFMRASRSMDYKGKEGMSDRDFFGNNQDYVGSSHLRSTELKKDRVAVQVLESAQFLMGMNDTTKGIFLDKVNLAQLTAYNMESKSHGTVDLKYKHVIDHAVAAEGDELYEGTVSIARKIIMFSKIDGQTFDDTWLGCCPKLILIPDMDRHIFGV